jgi:hypothetical protein
MDGPHSAGDEFSAEMPLQFGIRDLMIAQTVVLVCIGLLAAGLGLLGSIPWLTCVVFSRNARQAMRQARAAAGERMAILLFIAGALLAAAIPALIYLSLGPSVEHTLKSIPKPQSLFLH